MAYATNETKLWLRPSVKQRQKLVRGPYLCTRIGVLAIIGLLKKAIVDLPIRLKGNLKRISGNLLSSLGAQTKDLSTASQTLLTGVKLPLQRSLRGERI